MTKLFDKAIAEIKRLPPAEQDAIAAEWLDRMADEQKWEASFAKPKSRSAMAKLAAEARAEIAAGRTLDFDPSSRPKP
jgi:hypothetical protein